MPTSFLVNEPDVDRVFNKDCVIDPIAKWANEQPDKVAIVARDFELSYAELASQTNQIANALLGLGICRGDRVAFVLNRGPKTVLLIIGILKTGATYIPLDVNSPVHRIKDCLEDSDPSLVILEDPRELADGEQAHVAIHTLEKVLQLAETASDVYTPDSEARPNPDDLAYIIFTSGSTGRPKGVPITHASLTNFVEGNQQVCICVQPDDIVFQGFSPASDGHHEEIWPTLAAGATLAVASAKEVYSGLDLSSFLNDYKVSVISCAPTLLSMVDDDVPTIRRILFGAENLPASLVKRWWNPSRTILNTYGPTEATVGATFSECTPDSPITIGRPLPNYFCYIVRDDLTIVGPNEEGELCIAGVGVASGYFNRADLGVGKFIPNPYARDGQRDPILYRTGDRARYAEDGTIVWLGRIDGQVKIRGHRIELTEIESCLASCPGVQAGVVVVRESDEGDKYLVGLIVTREGDAFDIADALDHLRDHLPGHMVPAFLEEVERIPRLPSGKVDRAACQLLKGQAFRIERYIVPPRTENERLVIDAWRELFPQHEISATDDFFRDLGGYSLLASRFMTRLRNETRFSRVSVLDLYENPSVRAFAAVLDSQTHQKQTAVEFKPIPPKRYLAATLWQALGVMVLFTIQGFFWLGPIFAAIYLSVELGHHDIVALLLGVVVRAASEPLLFLLVIVLKWLVVGRLKEGTYPLWGAVHLRWWFISRLNAIAPVNHITGTPFAALYLRALGAKIGRNVLFEWFDVDCPDLIEIGDNCNFEHSAWIHAGEIVNGELHLGRVKIGEGCWIGERSGLAGGSTMEMGSVLRDITCVRSGETVPQGEEWYGSVARKATTRTVPEYDPSKQPSVAAFVFYSAVQLILVVLLAMLSSLPFVMIAFTLYNLSEGFKAYLWEPVYAVALVAAAALQTLLVKWVVLGKVKPGTYKAPGAYWLRKWFVDKHTELCSSSFGTIYDTIFARVWCLAMGMRCGPRCEIASPLRMPNDLMELGMESFIASDVSVGRPLIRNGALTLDRTVIGTRSFIGNESVVQQGAMIPDNSLMGILTVSPENQPGNERPNQAWLGSPPFLLPNRQVVNTFESTQTYLPTKRLYVQRLVHEIARVILPGLCSLIVASILVEGFVMIWDGLSFWIAVAAVPLLYLAGVLIGVLMCRLSKLVLIGTYRPTMQPLWSQFVWKTETHSAILHDFATTLFLSDLIGTPFMSAFMRFMGASIGKRACINTIDWTETDLLHLGDDVVVNANAVLQCHLFEDRVMKVGPVKLGHRCSVGSRAVILCESEVKNDAQIRHLSLVMKGETIPSHSVWAGSPAQACDDPA